MYPVYHVFHLGGAYIKNGKYSRYPVAIPLRGQLSLARLQEMRENIKKFMGGIKKMNDVVKIEGRELKVKNWKGERVVTFREIDELHGRTKGTAGRNFRKNKLKLIEDVDYYSLDSVSIDEFRRYNNGGFGEAAKHGVVITESGYLMLVKSFTDDLSWKIQRQLVNTYFKAKEFSQNKKDFESEPNTELVLNHILKKIANIENEINSLKNPNSLFYQPELKTPRQRFYETCKKVSKVNKTTIPYSTVYNKLEHMTGKRYRDMAKEKGMLVIDYIEEVGDIEKAITVAKELI